MERIQRNCRELMKVYQAEDINSPKAAAYRKKIFGLLRAAEAEPDGSPKAVELFWRTAYYDPIVAIKNRTDHDFLNYMVDIFVGEITSYIATPSRNVAQYYIMLGDLMRYSQSPLSKLQYRKAVEANPYLGKPFNQLALHEKDIKAIRFFLLSLSVADSFKNSADNLKKALAESTKQPFLDCATNIIKYMIFDLRRQELIKEFVKFTDLLEEKEYDHEFVKDNLPLIIQSLVIAHNVLPNRFGDDYFLVPIPYFAELFILLLKQHKLAEDSNEGISAGTRRRRISTASSNSGSDSEEEGAQEKSFSTDVTPTLWPVSLCCQWLMETTTRLSTFDRAITPVPAALRENLNTLTDKLIARLNELLRILPLKNDENSAEETNWLLNGPIHDGENCDAAQRQMAYWTEALTSCSEAEVEFTTYFRRKKADTSARKRIGVIQISKPVKTADTSWIPIFIILDYGVFEKYLQAIRIITAQNSVIPVVPSFVLAELDRMKSTGPNIRDAMRFIERKQAQGELRVMKCKTHLECAQELLKTSEGSSIESPLSALLVTDLEKYCNLTLPGLVTYHIEAFLERWKNIR